ncbi:MAG TPA: hypothetical protein VEV44_11125 [Pseudoneobacillus sp.]|nr:hypothetical protein [Pseudoneobacillus sp.]
MKTIVSSIISSVFKQESKSLQSTSLRPGQVFNGKILKLFPNQTAEVQIGNHKMIAQLDVPLQVGSRYWLQVQPGDGKILLKVLNDTSGTSVNLDGLEAVLKAFGLSSSKENLETVSYFLKEHLPVSKEIIQQVASWLKNIEHPENGLTTIKWMINQGYPIRKEIFESLYSMQKQIPISDMMNQLLNQLEMEGSNSTVSSSLKEVLINFTTKESKQAVEKILQNLFTQWIEGENEDIPFSLLKKLGIFPIHMDEKTALDEIIQKFNNQLSLTEHQQSLLKNLNIFQNANKLSFSVNQNEIEQIIQSLNLQEQEIAKLPAILTELMKHSTISSEKQILQTLMSLSDMNPSSFVESDLLHPILKKLIHSLGLQYEKDLFDQIKGLENEPIKQDTLKSLLIQHIGEQTDLSQREPAEQLLHRITGMQLLSKEMGPLMQVVMQIPIPLWDSVPELTVQWSGRKTEEGKIDPNYCRILFYLELENLKETIVDLKIQNRVISIKVINDNQQWLQNFRPLQEVLKENLKNMNFHLSSFQFEKANTQQIGKESNRSFPSIYNNQTYSGVDIKI